MKTLSTLISLILSLNCGINFAQSEPAVDSSPSTTENVAIQSQTAVAKSLVLFAIAMDANKKAQSELLLQCAAFGAEEGAPSTFVDTIKNMAQQQDSDILAQNVADLGKYVEEYKIDLSYLDIWRKSYPLKFSQMRTLLKGNLGDALIRAEGMTPIDEQYLATLSAEERQKQSSAIKAALFMLYIYNKENRHRATTEKRIQCAELASNMGAPSMFARLLLGETNSNISPKARYDLGQALQNMLWAYNVDRISLRLLGERYELDSQIADKLIAENKIPFATIYNNIQDMPAECTESEANEIAQNWAKNLRKMSALLKGIKENPHPDQALNEIYSLLPNYLHIMDIFYRANMTFSEKLSTESHESMKVAREEFIEELKFAYEERENLSPELRTFLNIFK